MSRRLVAVAAAAIAVTGAVVAPAVASRAAASGGSARARIVWGSVAPFARADRAIGAAPSVQELTVQLWLEPKVAAATSFAAAVSDPTSADFRQFLTPSTWTARFGPTRAAAAAATHWLRSEGFSGVHVDAQRSYVRATAAMPTIDRAFGVQMTRYRPTRSVTAGSADLIANDRPIRLPSSLAGLVSGVTGMDDALPTSARPAAVGGAATSGAKCSSYYGQHKVSGLPKRYGKTSFPTAVCGYSAKQLRGVYGANLTNTGKGQTVALDVLGLGAQMFATLQDYAKVMHLPKPSTSRFHQLDLHGKKDCGPLWDGGEEQLDIEASYAMAPGAKQLVVGADTCDNGDQGLQGLIDGDQAVINGNGNKPLASIVSNSWEGRFPQPAATTNVEHAFLLKAAAEGVGVYFASDDEPGIAIPQADPYATSVGGTTLGIGSHGNRLFETGWASNSSVPRKGKWHSTGELGGAGGGAAPQFKQPAYQVGVVPAALSSVASKGPYRTEPDISADADSATAMEIIMLNPAKDGHPKFVSTFGGGTSQATPTIAGMVAAAQQGQPKPFGFINPLLYSLNGTTAFRDVLPLSSSAPAAYRAAMCQPAFCLKDGLETFDIQDHTAPYSGQVVLKGYDDITGLGTPNGQHFIAGLRGAATAG